MVKANIGLQDAEKNLCKEILEKILATEVVMEMKIRNYHWNVKATNFNDLHSFFEEMYGTSAETIDEVAERIRML
jgi:starvation-inducible DNA-binding protein